MVITRLTEASAPRLISYSIWVVMFYKHEAGVRALCVSLVFVCVCAQQITSGFQIFSLSLDEAGRSRSPLSPPPGNQSAARAGN